MVKDATASNRLAVRVDHYVTGAQFPAIGPGSLENLDFAALIIDCSPCLGIQIVTFVFGGGCCGDPRLNLRQNVLVRATLTAVMGNLEHVRYKQGLAELL